MKLVIKQIHLFFFSQISSENHPVWFFHVNIEIKPLRISILNLKQFMSRNARIWRMTTQSVCVCVGNGSVCVRGMCLWSFLYFPDFRGHVFMLCIYVWFPWFHSSIFLLPFSCQDVLVCKKKQTLSLNSFFFRSIRTRHICQTVL